MPQTSGMLKQDKITFACCLSFWPFVFRLNILKFTQNTKPIWKSGGNMFPNQITRLILTKQKLRVCDIGIDTGDRRELEV